MTLVGITFFVFGVFLSLAIGFSLRSPACVLLYFYHVAAALFNWDNSLSNPSDSQRYFVQIADFSRFKPGTAATEWFIATVRDVLGADYFDMYMVLHLFGYLGIVMLYLICRRALQPLASASGQPHILLYVVCCLPGFHVWSSVMGKDELVFLGVTTFVWGVAEPTRRLFALAFGLTVCALVRPHVAAMLAASCAVAMILSSDVPFLGRLLLSGGLLFGLRASFPFLVEFVGIEVIDSEGSNEFVQRWQGRNLEGGSSIDISSYSVPFQIFTYLYRPLFVDAHSALGLVVSVENLILLAISLLGAPWIVTVLASGNDRFYSRFNLLFCAMTTIALASTTTNLGIAIRQKIMVLPSLLALVLTAYAARRAVTARSDELETEVAA